MQKPDARTVDELRIADRLPQAESFFHQSPSVATTALLRTALNERGLDKVLAVMALEITLRQLCSRSDAMSYS